MKWIRVADNLPVLGSDWEYCCLVCRENDDGKQFVFEAHYIDTTKCDEDDPPLIDPSYGEPYIGKGWHTLAEDSAGEFEYMYEALSNITHWCDKPAPPPK